jgi:hypothetical protein
MKDLLKKIYDYFEDPNHKKTTLVVTIIAIFVMFAGGLLIGNINWSALIKHETVSNVTTPEGIGGTQASNTTLEGIITYLGPDMYAEDNITYTLTDAKGNSIILLKANDQKLSIVEGLRAKVIGTKTKTMDGKNEVLLVKEVVIKNGAN